MLTDRISRQGYSCLLRHIQIMCGFKYWVKWGFECMLIGLLPTPWEVATSWVFFCAIFQGRSVSPRALKNGFSSCYCRKTDSGFISAFTFVKICIMWQSSCLTRIYQASLYWWAPWPVWCRAVVCWILKFQRNAKHPYSPAVCVSLLPSFLSSLCPSAIRKIHPSTALWYVVSCVFPFLCGSVLMSYLNHSACKLVCI